MKYFKVFISLKIIFLLFVLLNNTNNKNIFLYILEENEPIFF